MVQRSLPLAEQVRLQLLRWIRQERIIEADGSLPSEADLAERLGVSRATVRDALSRLEHDRLVIRRHGSGTYLNRAVAQIGAGLDSLLDPAALIERQGFRAAVAAPRVSRGALGKAAGEALSRPPDAPAVHLSALYLADRRPAAWLEAAFPAPAADGADLPQFHSLEQFAASVLDEAPTHSVTAFQPLSAGKALARALKLPPGQALLALSEVHITDLGLPAFYSRTCFSPGVVRLQIVRDTERAEGRIAIW